MIRSLRPSDIPAGIRLKDAAGWNQTEQDWVNLLELAPDGCFGIDCEGVLAATAAAVCYERRLAWIGMVLTAPEFRGRGFARRLMEHTLDYLFARGIEWIKLDATDMGRPLYAKLGFQDEGLVERWARQPDSGPQPCPSGLAPLRLDALDTQLDLEAFGADRVAILHRVAIESACIPGHAYAMGRPSSKAPYFGPCVSRSAEAARSLLQWFLAAHPGEMVFWDLLPCNTEALRLAQEFGFERRRQLVRMALPGVPNFAPFAHSDAAVFAIAGFEYG